MRRIAANKVLFIPSMQVLTQQTVEVSAGGTFHSCIPLTHETGYTEWWPGIILVSPVEADRHGTEAFSSMITRLSTQSIHLSAGMPQKVILVSPFDTVRMEFLPNSSIKILRSEDDRRPNRGRSIS